MFIPKIGDNFDCLPPLSKSIFGIYASWDIGIDLKMWKVSLSQSVTLSRKDERFLKTICIEGSCKADYTPVFCEKVSQSLSGFKHF